MKDQKGGTSLELKKNKAEQQANKFEQMSTKTSKQKGMDGMHKTCINFMRLFDAKCHEGETHFVTSDILGGLFLWKN